MCYSFSKSMGFKNVKFAHTYDYSKRRRNEFHLLILITIELFANLSNCSGTITSNDQQTTFIRALAIVPTMHKESDLNLLPTWMKGEEILPAIQLAVKEINEQYNFLRGHQLEVIPVTVPMCDLNEGNLQFVKILETSTEILGFVGYVCQNLDQHFVHLLKHKEISAIQITANTPPVTTDKYSRSGSHLQFSILPSSQSTARAAVQLMQKLEWKHIAVISSKTYFIQRTEFLQEAKAHGIEVTLNLQTSTRTSNTILKQLQTAGINIIVSLLPPSEFVNILCCAYLEGIKWPHYAWIFLADIENFNEFQLSQKICSQNTSFIAAMNNTILIRQKSPTSNANNILPSGLTYSNYYSRYLHELEEQKIELNATLQINPYANVLYDSIWALAISLNRSLNILKLNNFSLTNIGHAKSEILEILGEQLSELSFHGATGYLNFSRNNASALQTTVKLLQFQNSNLVMIGAYDFTSDLLQLNATTLKLFSIIATLQYSFVMLHNRPVQVLVITLILTVLCFVLTTVSMFLYCYYRKQPSIKATSTTLSSCLFVGCYILVLSLLFCSIKSSLQLSKEQVMQIKASFAYQVFLCTGDMFLLLIAIDIIFATIIAKTLRIYHIFNTFGKVNRMCSDQYLFFFILIIVSVKVVLLALWTSLDVNHLAFNEQYISQSVPPYIIVTSKCQSNYLELWTGILFGYSSLLMLIMIVIAALTRKIEYQNFNDSKIICNLVYLLVTNMCITVPLYFIFYYVGSKTAHILVFNAGVIITVFLIQAVLIMPKICPLVKYSCQQSFHNQTPH